MTVSIATACRQAWKSERVEKIADVADGLRLNEGFDFAQIHAIFRESTGKDISLVNFYEIIRLADCGYTGTMAKLSRKVSEL